jgi:hypothetical protein
MMAIRHHRAQEVSYQPSLLEKSISYAALIFAIYTVLRPLVFINSLEIYHVLIRLSWGMIFLLLVFYDIKFMRKVIRFSSNTKQWLLRHIIMMTAAYFTTISAFLVNNIRLELWWIFWLLPPFVIVLVIMVMLSYWRGKLQIKK